MRSPFLYTGIICSSYNSYSVSTDWARSNPPFAGDGAPPLACTYSLITSSLSLSFFPIRIRTMGPLHLVDFIMFRDGLDRRCFCVYTRSIFISHRRNPFASSLFCLVHRKFLKKFSSLFFHTLCIRGDHHQLNDSSSPVRATEQTLKI